MPPLPPVQAHDRRNMQPMRKEISSMTNDKDNIGNADAVTECEIMEPDEDGWSEWVHPLPNYIMECCDCGLQHEMETAIVKAHDLITPTSEGEDKNHVIIFRMRRI
jgi:hypothetical protein